MKFSFIYCYYSCVFPRNIFAFKMWGVACMGAIGTIWAQYRYLMNMSRPMGCDAFISLFSNVFINLIISAYRWFLTSFNTMNLIEDDSAVNLLKSKVILYLRWAAGIFLFSETNFSSDINTWYRSWIVNFLGTSCFFNVGSDSSVMNKNWPYGFIFSATFITLSPPKKDLTDV